MEKSIDIAAVLDRIRPKAAWRMSDTYENLKATWEDTEQACPTVEEIESTWAEMQTEASTPQIITPEVDQEKADLWEAILALTEKIETLEGGNS